MTLSWRWTRELGMGSTSVVVVIVPQKTKWLFLGFWCLKFWTNPSGKGTPSLRKGLLACWLVVGLLIGIGWFLSQHFELAIIVFFCLFTLWVCFPYLPRYQGSHGPDLFVSLALPGMQLIRKEWTNRAHPEACCEVFTIVLSEKMNPSVIDFYPSIMNCPNPINNADFRIKSPLSSIPGEQKVRAVSR